MEPEKALECQGKVHVFPLVAKGDVCSAFNSIPAVKEAGSIKECTDRIADAFQRWHSRKGIDTPMPGWIFNRQVKRFPTPVVELAKDRFVKQGYLVCTPLMNNGKSGLAYSLKIDTKNN